MLLLLLLLPLLLFLGSSSCLKVIVVNRNYRAVVEFCSGLLKAIGKKDLGRRFGGWFYGDAQLAERALLEDVAAEEEGEGAEEDWEVLAHGGGDGVVFGDDGGTEWLDWNGIHKGG